MASLAPEYEHSLELTLDVLERWERESIPCNIVSETNRGIWVNHNRFCVDSWFRVRYWTYPVTWLYQCDMCGKLSTPRKIRDVPYEWWRFAFLANSISDLCMSCWGRVMAQQRKLLAIYELEKLLRQIEKKRLECLRSQRKVLESA